MGVFEKGKQKGALKTVQRMGFCKKGTRKGVPKTPRGWASVRKEPEMYPESSLRRGAFEKGNQKGARKLLEHEFQ